MRVVMIGSGYVGLVTGTCLAEVGHHVICVDIDKGKVDRLKKGVSPIYEPHLSEMIVKNIEVGRLEFTTSLKAALKGADATFLAVGTPEDEDGSADLSYILQVARGIGESADKSMLAIVKSTVPVGTCDLVEETICRELSERGVDHKISVASNPEFLKEGSAIQDFMHPDRIVVGVNSSSDLDTLKEVYSSFILDDPTKLLSMDRKSSELAKYGSNSMLATRISFMNELSQLCESVGANIDHVRKGIGSDPRIGKDFLLAGPGYGGSCFPKDVSALLQAADENGVDFHILRAVIQANKDQKNWVSKKISRYFGDLVGKRVAVWGLAFKPGTDDVREAPAAQIISYLIEKGSTVVAHDPQAASNFRRSFGESGKLIYVDEVYEAVRGADALVLVTEWSDYLNPDWSKIESLMNQRVVFDLRNQYDPAFLMETGFHYECVGRPDSLVQHSIH